MALVYPSIRLFLLTDWNYIIIRESSLTMTRVSSDCIAIAFEMTANSWWELSTTSMRVHRNTNLFSVRNLASIILKRAIIKTLLRFKILLRMNKCSCRITFWRWLIIRATNIFQISVDSQKHRNLYTMEYLINLKTPKSNWKKSLRSLAKHPL